MPDGTVLSLAVYSLVDGRCADSYFLYATDYDTFSEPYARISIAADSSEMLRYEDTEEHPFQAPVLVPEKFCGEAAYMEYAETYMDIREFVFANHLDENQKMALRRYLEVFQQATHDQFESCYQEMAEGFLQWAEEAL